MVFDDSADRVAVVTSAGADLSFFYGWFLGVSPNLDAVAFDTLSYEGFDEVETLIGSVAVNCRTNIRACGRRRS